MFKNLTNIVNNLLESSEFGEVESKTLTSGDLFDHAIEFDSDDPSELKDIIQAINTGNPVYIHLGGPGILVMRYSVEVEELLKNPGESRQTNPHERTLEMWARKEHREYALRDNPNGKYIIAADWGDDDEYVVTNDIHNLKYLIYGHLMLDGVAVE